MVNGISIMLWDERVGAKIISKYPDSLEIPHRISIQIYSAHGFSEEAGVLSLMIGSANIVSYYTGPKKGIFINLFLSIEENSEDYESIIMDLSQDLLIKQTDFSDFDLSNFFKRICDTLYYNNSQKMCDFYRDGIKNWILQILRESGSIIKTDLKVILEDKYGVEINDLNGILQQFVKLDLIKILHIKGDSSERIFLINDIILNLQPVINNLKNPQTLDLPSNLFNQYLKICKDFFTNYNFTVNQKIIELFLDFDIHKIINLLSSGIVISDKIDIYENIKIKNINNHLKKLLDANLLCALQDDKGINYFLLVAKINVKKIVPEYLINLIIEDFNIKNKTQRILVEHLILLAENCGANITKGIFSSILQHFEEIEVEETIKKEKKIEEEIRKEKIKASESFAGLPLIETNISLDKFFTTKERYVFLVGSGISAIPPSSLPLFKEISNTLIDYCIPGEYIEKILKLDNLTPELVFSSLKYTLDKELTFLDYFNEITEYNNLHSFLAGVITRGQYVITTTLDNLIEEAFKNNGFDEKSIVPIITKEDYLKFNNPDVMIEEKRYPICKIYGSKQNIITSQDTKDSVLPYFSKLIEPLRNQKSYEIKQFQNSTLFNILKECTLVVMGYEENDYLNINYILNEFPYINKIIWVNNISTEKIKIFQLGEDIKNEENLDIENKYLKQIIIDINRKYKLIEIYRIDCNINFLISEFLWKFFNISEIISEPKSTSKNFIDFSSWIMTNLDYKNKVLKYEMAALIYYNLSLYNEAHHCLKKSLELINNDLSKEFSLIIKIGKIQEIFGNLNEALKYYNKGLSISEKLNDLNKKVICLYYIYEILERQGKENLIIKQITETLEIIDQIQNVELKFYFLIKIGNLYMNQQAYSDALELYKNAFQIAEHSDNPFYKIKILQKLGELHKIQDKFEISLNFFNDALQIANQYSILELKSQILNRIGELKFKEKDFSDALKKYMEAFLLIKKSGNIKEKSKVLQNITNLHLSKKAFSNALKNINEELQLNIKNRNENRKLKNIQMIKNILKDYKKELFNLKENL
ncbi:MAG: hypothetical protein ACTSPY_10910 [Candidatus Helarchaeota archaeon]